LLVLALCATVPAVGQPSQNCKPVAVQGLSDDDLTRIVLAEVAAVVQVPVAAIDMAKSLKSLDRSENGVMTYGFFFLNIERRLNIRLSMASAEVRASLNSTTVGEAYERSTIRSLGAVVRSAFHNTPNCAP
jgi:hypothetical protein